MISAEPLFDKAMDPYRSRTERHVRALAKACRQRTLTLPLSLTLNPIPNPNDNHNHNHNNHNRNNRHNHFRAPLRKISSRLPQSKPSRRTSKTCSVTTG